MANCIAQKNSSPVYSDNQRCLVKFFIYIQNHDALFGERDTYRGNTIENRGCLDIRMSFCTLTLRIFVFAWRSTLSQTSLNRILWFSDHYPYHLRH